MLAPLLLNLGSGPTPPKPPVVQPFFAQGGGPFLRKYGYDWDVYEDEESSIASEARKALPDAKAVKAEEAIYRAVQAIRNDETPRIVLDSQKLYEKVFLSLRGELRQEIKGIIKARVEHDRLQELWRAEVQRRIQQDQEEEVICLMFL